ncbi:testis-specific serine/threonine-protein kinase 1-like [Glandiceps talaboti]
MPYESDKKILYGYGVLLDDDGVLGEGSYAKVKSGWYRTIDKPVAVKIIAKRKGRAFRKLMKFLPRELEVIQRLHHKNIIRVYDVVQTDDRVYIVMEKAARGDLLAYMKLGGTFNEKSAKKVFRDLVEVVKFCHDNNIVHRDLKCENILLDERLQVKLTDFGFSKHCINDSLSETFCGSAAYSSPEILLGKRYRPKASDIWSLGVVLYILLTGMMPYDDANPRAQIREQLSGKVPVEEKTPFSKNVKKLLESMLNPDEERRATVDDVLKSDWLKTWPFFSLKMWKL